MEQFRDERLRRLTPQDLRTFYPQALSLALRFLLESVETGSGGSAPLWKAMGYYLTNLRKRVADCRHGRCRELHA